MSDTARPPHASTSGAMLSVLPPWSRRQRAAAVAGPVTIVAIFAASVFLSATRYKEARDWVGHTHRVLEATHATYADLQEAETGQRGYLLTGDSAYLAPYRAAIGRLTPDTSLLRSLTQDRREHQERLDALESLVRAKFSELDSTVTLRDAGQAQAAIAVLRTGLGRALMDSIRAQIGAMMATEDSLLLARQAAEARVARTSVVIVIAGALLAVLLTLATNRLLANVADRHANQAREIAAQATELVVANEQLQDQQLELETANDQLQEQATELEAQQSEMEMQAEELTAANDGLVVANLKLAETVAQVEASEARIHAALQAEHAARAAADEARAEAELANRAKSQFLSTMSHELRTPLNAIGGHAQLIELGVYGAVTEAQRDALARITKAQEHLLSLINDVLSLSRIEAGKLDYDVREVPVAEVVSDVVAMVETQLAAKRMALSVQVAGGNGVPLRAWADRDRLRQVLLNLLSNAAKFTPDGGTVSVTVSERADRSDQLIIAVRDSGYGIPTEKLTAVFEPFVQLHRESPGGGRDVASLQGTGLGLAISRDLMHGMGGDITVESVENEGSTFTVTLRRVGVVDGAPDRGAVAADVTRARDVRAGQERSG